MKPLIFIPSPRYIPEVVNAIHELPEDKYWVKYHEQTEAYKIARYFFLAHDYTHLCILPDDLIVSVEGYNTLIRDIMDNDFQVISGACNVDNGHYKNCLNVTPTYLINPTSPPEGHYKKWLKIQEAEEIVSQGYSLYEVKFSGFPLMFIRRDVVEILPFRDYNGCCIDSTFCSDCVMLEIPIYVDLRVIMKHLKIDNVAVDESFGTGKKEPQVVFEPYCKSTVS
jgi:hypothetical protein